MADCVFDEREGDACNVYVGYSVFDYVNVSSLR